MLYLQTGISLTFSSGFSHVRKARICFISPRGSHSSAPSADSISKPHNRRPIIRRCSMYERCFPIHPRGPSEKACEAPNLSLAYSLLFNQRSGRYSSGLVQLSSLWHAAHEDTATEVCQMCQFMSEKGVWYMSIYAARNPMSIYRVTSTRHSAEKSCRDWRKDPQSLFDTCI